MPLPSPQLDDRDFEQLVEEARRLIRESDSGWTDLSPADPGMTLVEALAHITEVLLYRLNRLPDKAYVGFLRLLGITRQPPTSAAVDLVFSRSGEGGDEIEIPRGTRVTLARSGGEGPAPVFTTDASATLPAGEDRVVVRAHHCELVTAEPAGEGTGRPGQTVTAGRPPLVAPTGAEMDLVVAVEADPDELPESARALRHGGSTYRVWREVESFDEVESDRHVYTSDRLSGLVRFAPALRRRDEEGEMEATPRTLAAVPGEGREILLWYRRGGGADGNVAAGTLTVLKDSLPGLEVTNPEPATGGREAESLENALERGPREFRSLRRTVTAGDYEQAAIRESGAVARARAFTRAEKWAHAEPGTVEVLLVPRVSDAGAGAPVTPERLAEHRSTRDLGRIESVLEERRPLGTRTTVGWARMKTVRVEATVVVYREADRAAVERRIERRLRAMISPLPTEENPEGWRFGGTLRASHVYEVALSEPGVDHVRDVRFRVEEAPDGRVSALAPDPFQLSTWYAGSGETLYRSMNDGEGWERTARFEEESVEVVEPDPHRAGLLAVATIREGAEQPSAVHLSFDCGESWPQVVRVGFRIRDLAWVQREDTPELLMATEAGLFRLPLSRGARPVQALVRGSGQEEGLYAVAVAETVRGDQQVAVAAEEQRGVFLSVRGGRSGTFEPSGLEGRDVRILAVQRVGNVRYLWAGHAAAGGEPGTGCSRLRLSGTGEGEGSQAWRDFEQGWSGGSCLSLAFHRSGGEDPHAVVVAGSHRSGVLHLDPSSSGGWTASEVDSGLPLRDAGRLHPVFTVASDPDHRWVMAGGPRGVYRAGELEDGEGSDLFRNVSQRTFGDRVTLPDTWLFCSGQHGVEAVTEDQASG